MRFLVVDRLFDSSGAGDKPGLFIFTVGWTLHIYGWQYLVFMASSRDATGVGLFSATKKSSDLPAAVGEISHSWFPVRVP